MMIFNGYTKRDFSKANKYIINLAEKIIANLDNFQKSKVVIDLPHPYKGKDEALMSALAVKYFPYETVRPTSDILDDFMEISQRVYGRVFIYPKRIKELLEHNLRVYNSLLQIVKDLNIENLSDIEKAIRIHDYVCQKLHYCNGDGHLWVRFSKLIDGDCTVCNGYSRLYTALCDVAGLECLSIENDDHEWNKVKIDGKWLFVDCTWDDGDSVRRTYCLKTKKEFYTLLKHPKAKRKSNYWKV